jgi:single-stranded-DNA-specific exonuclease
MTGIGGEYSPAVNVFPAPILRWVVSPPPDPGEVNRLAAQLGIPTALAALLVQRGQGNEADARSFLRPSVTALSDAGALAGMAEAVEAIAATVRAGGTIMVHGDYDVDGQCATALRAPTWSASCPTGCATGTTSAPPVWPPPSGSACRW